VLVYCFAPPGEGRVLARFFFMAHGAVLEDPATGSAAANLGGWLLATGAARPVRLEIEQGAEVARPSRLRLEVDEGGAVHVSGEVVELGRGVLAI
jgi:PhzF family phenazine biosynthesis protein